MCLSSAPALPRLRCASRDRRACGRRGRRGARRRTGGAAGRRPARSGCPRRAVRWAPRVVQAAARFLAAGTACVALHLRSEAHSTLRTRSAAWAACWAAAAAEAEEEEEEEEEEELEARTVGLLTGRATVGTAERQPRSVHLSRKQLACGGGRDLALSEGPAGTRTLVEPFGLSVSQTSSVAQSGSVTQFGGAAGSPVPCDEIAVRVGQLALRFDLADDIPVLQAAAGMWGEPPPPPQPLAVSPPSVIEAEAAGDKVSSGGGGGGGGADAMVSSVTASSGSSSASSGGTLAASCRRVEVSCLGVRATCLLERLEAALEARDKRLSLSIRGDPSATLPAPAPIRQGAVRPPVPSSGLKRRPQQLRRGCAAGCAATDRSLFSRCASSTSISRSPDGDAGGRSNLADGDALAGAPTRRRRGRRLGRRRPPLSDGAAAAWQLPLHTNSGGRTAASLPSAPSVSLHVKLHGLEGHHSSTLNPVPAPPCSSFSVPPSKPYAADGGSIASEGLTDAALVRFDRFRLSVARSGKPVEAMLIEGAGMATKSNAGADGGGGGGRRADGQRSRGAAR